MERLAVALLIVFTILVPARSALRAQSAGAAPGSASPNPGDGGRNAAPPTCTMCVSEPKAKTKKVYRCRVEEYCLPRWSWPWPWCGQRDCANGGCGELKVRHRLVVRSVPDGTAPQCLPRQVPMAPSACPNPK